jgi:hypothetical protein
MHIFQCTVEKFWQIRASVSHSSDAWSGSVGRGARVRCVQRNKVQTGVCVGVSDALHYSSAARRGFDVVYVRHWHASPSDVSDVSRPHPMQSVCASDACFKSLLTFK